MYKLLLLLTVLLTMNAAQAAEPIRIGEMFSYTGGANLAAAYKEGWQLAVEEINAKGGVAGRQVEVISRDDKADPGEAVRVAEELVRRDKVDALFGGGFDHVGLALGTYANANKVVFLKQWGGKCDKVEDPNNKYWFTSMPCMDVYSRMYARQMAKLPYKRWATIGPNYEFGRNIIGGFKTELKTLRPDVEFVAERWPTLGKIKAQEEVRALTAAKPDAVFNQLFEGDLVQYLRTAEKLGFLKDRYHVGNDLGDSLNIRQLGAAYPIGWFTLGAPDNPDTKDAKEFYARFEKRYGHKPTTSGMQAYGAMKLLLAGLERSKGAGGEKLMTSMVGAKTTGPLGDLVMRPDRQIYHGYWLGYTDRVDGKGRFVKWTWHTAEELFKD